MAIGERRECVIVTFYTTAEAMATKKLCIEKNIPGKMISAPRALSADCGIAWRSDAGCRELLKISLDEADIEYAGIHEMTI